MSARSTMTHRTTIERDQAGADSSWGGTATPDWQPLLTGQPCRLWFKAGRQVVDGAKTAAIEDFRLLLPVDVDVTTRDRVGSVTDRLGRVIMEGPMLIDTVGRRRDHLAVMLKEPV
jgi:hypothetical protein